MHAQSCHSLTMDDITARREYERLRRREWRAKNPDHVREYAREYYGRAATLREARIAKPCAEGKPDTFTCTKCKIDLPFNLQHFNHAKQNKFKLTYQCRKCMLERFSFLQAKRKYKLTDEQVTYLRTQKACFICKAEGPLQFDHCHAKGNFRGMLCGHCNKALGLMRDNPDRLRAAAAYLELT